MPKQRIESPRLFAVLYRNPENSKRREFSFGEFERVGGAYGQGPYIYEDEATAQDDADGFDEDACAEVVEVELHIVSETRGRKPREAKHA